MTFFITLEGKFRAEKNYGHDSVIMRFLRQNIFIFMIAILKTVVRHFSKFPLVLYRIMTSSNVVIQTVLEIKVDWKKKLGD